MLMVTDQHMLTRTPPVSPTPGLTPTMATTSSLELTLYQIAAQEVAARPAALGQAVSERFGFCPPLPGPGAVAQGQLSAEAFAELAASRARWSGQVAAYVYENARPHLLLVRQEALPASEQALLLQDPHQAGYSRARAAEFAARRRTVAAAVDDGLGQLLAAMDLNFATVLVASEHGTAPVHTGVNVAVVQTSVQRLLREMDRRGISTAEAALRLRAEGGFLSVEIEAAAADRDTIREAVIGTLAALADPRTGEGVLARVARIEEAETWAAAWPHPGDVAAQARPGYALTIGSEGEPTFSDGPIYGQAGYDPDLPTMQGAFIAAGWGVSGGDTLPIARLLEIAPTMTHWLALSDGP
jgi:hypothetical protein